MTRSAIPDPRDEPCRDRETVRLPRSTSDEIDELVDEGRYPNRSAFIRAGARLLLKCEREDVWPSFGNKREQEGVEDESPDSLQEVAAANAEPSAEPTAGEPAADASAEPSDAKPAADGGIAGAVDEETTAQTAVVDVELAGNSDARGAADDAYEYVAESPAVSEADIVTKLSAVMRETTAGERAVIAS